MNEIKSLNFIEEIIENDIESGLHGGKVVTRFPPEPNGYLHIGHAKAICLNFGLAARYNGVTNLRFDDTNPVTEDVEYVDSIKNDIKWLGFNWDQELYASGYFDQLFEYAMQLIKKNLAYVDDLTSEEIANLKGSPTEPGKDSPFRNRSIEENMDLFTRMRNGDFPDGAKVLRARIDMKHINMLMRDPIMYRIKHASHHRTGDKWCIYPMYDFAHGQCDSLEGITHSICTLEFIPHRELYNWFIEKLEIFPSKQYEFARLNLIYTVMSKRKLLQLVNDKYVDGWDDPRMPTLSAYRRKGYTPESIRMFCDKVGVQKRDNLIELGLLEYCVREDLIKKATRVMVVLDPIKVTITNFNGAEEELTGENNPDNESAGTRIIPFSSELYIERDDFQEVPEKKWFRLAPGAMVRLKSAYIIRCDEFIKDSNGNVTELKCTYFPESKSGHDTSGLTVKGVIHWVSTRHAINVKVRLYEQLFKVENPAAEEGDFKEYVNPTSLEIIDNAKAEPFLADTKPGDHFQFMRKGYFCTDTESREGALVFNRTVSLKDTWVKQSSK
jgi:glutaminyl-tRNA synthetase